MVIGRSFFTIFEDYSLEQLQKHLRIEEESRVRDKLERGNLGTTSKANAVSKPKKSNKKNSENKLGPKKDQDKFKSSQAKKPKGGCYVCGKPGHFARECRHCKGQTNEANATSTEDEIIAIVSEIMAVESKISGWWYNTVHISYDKSLFKNYNEVNDG